MTKDSLFGQLAYTVYNVSQKFFLPPPMFSEYFFNNWIFETKIVPAYVHICAKSQNFI